MYVSLNLWLVKTRRCFGQTSVRICIEFVQEYGILSSSQKKLIGARGYRVAPCVRTLGTRITPGRATFHSSESAPAGNRTVVVDSTDGAANQAGLVTSMLGIEMELVQV